MNRRKSSLICRVFTVAAVVFIAGTSGASDSVTGTVERLMMDENYDTKLFVKMSSPVLNPISCSTHPIWDFVLDVNTEFGWQMYAILLNAYHKNTQVTLLGKDDCGVFAGVETLRRVDLL